MNWFKAIPALWKTKNLIQKDIKEIKTMDIKSGWKTTEFWSKIAAQATVLWAAVGGFVPPKYAAIVVVVAEGVYTIARTLLKMNESIQAAKSNQTTVTTTEPVTTVTTPAQ